MTEPKRRNADHVHSETVDLDAIQVLAAPFDSAERQPEREHQARPSFWSLYIERDVVWADD